MSAPCAVVCSQLLEKLLNANKIDSTQMKPQHSRANARGGGAAQRRHRRACIRLGSRVGVRANAVTDTGNSAVGISTG